MWSYIGHTVWNVPICLCVCACYLRQLLTQLRAGGPWHQCGWREARFWRRVQRVLNPGLLEGSLSFSHSSLSRALPFLFFSHQLYAKLLVRQCFSLTSCMRCMLSVTDEWEAACSICRLGTHTNAHLKSYLHLVITFISLEIERSNAGLLVWADKST